MDADIAEVVTLSGSSPLALEDIAKAKVNLTCTFCNRQFSTNQNLQRHMRQKHLGFRYPCKVCRVEFLRKEDIHRHYCRYHPNRVGEVRGIKPVSMMMVDGLDELQNHISAKQWNRMVGVERRSKYAKKDTCRLGTKISTAGRQTLSKNETNSDIRLEQSGNFHGVRNAPVANSQSVHVAGVSGDAQTPAPQQATVAIDPLTHFRLERVIAERVSRITEKCVVETLDNFGQVTRRETIEREYYLNGSENLGS